MRAITAQARHVREHSPRSAQQCIDQQLAMSLHYHAQHPEHIDARMRELSEEWDIERTLEANAATITLASVVTGLITGRRSYLLAGVVSGFLLQHAIQGWCPPLPFFRRRGVRSKDEIMQEHFGLRLLRDGIERLQDMRDASPDERARVVLDVLGANDHEPDHEQRGSPENEAAGGEWPQSADEVAVDPVSVGQRRTDDDI